LDLTETPEPRVLDEEAAPETDNDAIGVEGFPGELQESLPTVAAPDREGPPSDAPPRRLVVPDKASQLRIDRQVEEIYHLSAVNSDAKRLQLARELFDLGDQTQERPDERFVFYRRAMELASEGGDAELMLASIDAIGAEYDVDTNGVQAKMLRQFVGDGGDARRVMSFLKCSERVVRKALAADQLDTASQISGAAYRFCDRPIGSTDFREAIRKRHLQVEKIREQYEQVKQAQAILQTLPDHADAHLVLGRWYCFVKNDWESGLFHLAHGSNETLKAIALREIGNRSESPVTPIEMGDAWWEHSKSIDENERPPLLRRALHWYGQVITSDLVGIDKLKVENRQQEITSLLAEVAPSVLDISQSPPVEDGVLPAPGEEGVPDEFRSAFTRGITAALQERDFALAQRLFARCEKLQPQHVPTLNNLALASVRNRDYRQALRLFQDAVELKPESRELKHNLLRFRHLAEGDLISLDRTLVNLLDGLCRKATSSDQYTGRSGWCYLPLDGDSSYYRSDYLDRCCMYCGGTGYIDCPVRGCSNGTVRSTRTDVVGRNSVTGTPILKSTPIRVRCDTCNGRGKVDCPRCSGGIAGGTY
jgi:tetratricopeptide (TPR) repeat protein